MNKEHVQWAVIGVLVVAVAAVGTLVKKQNEQLRLIAQSVSVMSLKLESAADSTGGKLLLPEPAITASNRFIFGTHKVGDVIAGLKIVAIEPIPGLSQPFGSDNYQVRFSGQKTFNGAYFYQEDSFAGGSVAIISSINADELPMKSGEIGDNSFEVSNLDKFRQLIGKEYGTGRTTVVMENFTLRYAPAEVRDSADLVRVISKSKY